METPMASPSRALLRERSAITKKCRFCPAAIGTPAPERRPLKRTSPFWKLALPTSGSWARVPSTPSLLPSKRSESRLGSPSRSLRDPGPVVSLVKEISESVFVTEYEFAITTSARRRPVCPGRPDEDGTAVEESVIRSAVLMVSAAGLATT